MITTMHEVLVLTPSFGEHSSLPWSELESAGLRPRRPRGAHPLTSQQLRAEIGDAEALIVGLDEVDADAIAAGPNLKVIAKHGVGVDNIDVAAAAERGITVTNVPGANSGAVADLVMGVTLAMARRLIPAHRNVTSGGWDRFFGPELSGKTMAILGFGRIGREVCRRAFGFGMTVVAHDPYVPGADVAEAGAEPVDRETALSSGDVVTLHVPGAPGGPLIDRDQLARMRPGAYLVNTARGALVDEVAVAEALESGALAGYAADAFTREPPRDSPLLTAPNTILTPHIGAFTDRANETMGTTVVRDVARVLRGHSPEHPVRP